MVMFTWIQKSCIVFKVFIIIIIIIIVCLTECSTANDKLLETTEKFNKFTSIKQLLPGWTYYSLDRRKQLTDIKLSENILYSKHKLNCQTNVCIKTLKILLENVFLKGNVCLKLCHQNEQTANVISSKYDLILPIPWEDYFIDISQIFPSTYKPMRIKCGNIVRKFISITKDGKLKLDKNTRRTKKLSSHLKCLVSANNINRKTLNRLLHISFTSIFQTLSRKRRSTAITFDKDTFYIKVKENINVGDTILTLKAKGGSGKYFYVKSTDVKSDRLFVVDSKTGEIKIQEKLNREKGATQFTIDVTAKDQSDMKLTGRTTVVVTILDVNDNAPIFLQHTYRKKVKEEQQTGRFILAMQATDADEGINKEIKYSIVKEDGIRCPFKIDPHTGFLTNTEVLDREVKPYYVIKIKAEDKGIDPGPLSSFATVKISLIDENDNSPVFTQKEYLVSFPENTTAGTVIATIRVTDKDSGDNGKIQYQQINSDQFTINTITGEVTLNEALDYDRYQRDFVFDITALDRGLIPNYSSAQLKITVEDVNDNYPRFTRSSFKTSRPVLEDTAVGTTILKVLARDIDSGSNGDITYAFDVSAPKNLPFKIDSKKGDIKVLRKLDYETMQSYKFYVTATDNGKPPKSSKASVTIEIDNINDNPPRFINSTYKIDLLEDTWKGVPFLTVSATDPDQLSNADFDYSIVEGDPDRCFSIDLGGVSLVNCKLDYKKQKEYKLKLKVTDDDNKAGYAYLIINIYDANNNAPRFAMAVNTIVVKEDAPISASVGFVTATDGDTGENARIAYSINKDDTFAMNKSTGEITTKKLLDRETQASYQFIITAKDHGKPFPKSGTTTVFITVRDVNDNYPTFLELSYTITIPEEQSAGFVVRAVSAVDKDFGFNKEIRYFLAPNGDGDGSFSIGADSGIIKTKKVLDREKVASYRLIVIAEDQGVDRKLNTSVNVYINLKDSPDSSPVFEKKLYEFPIEENSNTNIGQVKATYPDVLYQESIQYSVSKDVHNLFIIEMRTGIIQLRRETLDYERQHQYQIEVRVSVESGKTDTTLVNIKVTDVNDNAPELEDFYISLNIINGRFDPIFKVSAFDRDISSKLSYGILSGNEHNFVKLNRNTGQLYLEKSIMNAATEIRIKFEVSDGRFRTHATGRISVSEVTSEMVANSIFIVLNATNKNTFLQASVLKIFKDALASVFSCDSGRIFMISIEDFKHSLNSGIKNTHKLLEVAIAVRKELTDHYLKSKILKDLLYLKQGQFEQALLGIKLISFDFWDEYFCGTESCTGFEKCSVASLNAQNKSSTVESKNGSVIFRGVNIQQKLICQCLTGYRDGPDMTNNICSERYSLCYSKPCGDDGTCISTDIGFTCICDTGYRGKYCHINKDISTCPKSTPFALTSNPCGQQGTCLTKDGDKGFNCRCLTPDKVDGPFCTLATRHFPKHSFLMMKGLQQRWNISISLEFTTSESNGILLYNGRYSNSNDFIAIEIVDGQVSFSVSLGKANHISEQVDTVKSFIPGGVNDGNWHLVKVHFNIKKIEIAVTKLCKQCDNSCDIKTAHLVNPDGKKKYCSASKPLVAHMRSLDLSAPLHIGGFPTLGRPFRMKSSDFIGCIRKVTIDHALLDLANPLKDSGTNAKCEPKQAFCTHKNPCRNGQCFDGFGGPYCECNNGFSGKHCEKNVKISSPVITLIESSELYMAKNSKSGSKPWTTSLLVKTTQRNAIIWEEHVDTVKAYLKISDGYACYVFDSTVVMNLTNLFISNGKWHQVEIHWESNLLLLTADYKSHQVSRTLYRNFASYSLLKIGGHGNDSFVGCLKDLTVTGKQISLISNQNKNVRNTCSLSDVCFARGSCGLNGKCKEVYGSPECVCKPNYQGPQCTDICLTNPCLNDGKCVNTGSLQPGFKCQCSAKYTGEFCEVTIKNNCGDGYYSVPGTGSCGPCTCKTSQNYHIVCDKDGKQYKNSFPGKCFCQDEFYNSNGQCVPCGCLPEGSIKIHMPSQLSSMIDQRNLTCNKLTGQCNCLPGITGQKCDRCPGAWEELTDECNEINTSCPKAYMEGIWWSRIRPGKTQVTDCPRGAIGNATRYCHMRKSWLTPSLFGCTSINFENVRVLTNLIVTGHSPLNQKVAIQLASQLDFAAGSAIRLYGKDIEIGYEVLTMLVGHEGNQTKDNLVSSEDQDFVKNIVYSTSRLFTLSSKEFWDLIQKKYAGTAGLMKQMEKFVRILAMNLGYIKRRRTRRSVVTLIPYSQASEDIYLEVQPIYLEHDKTFTFPQQQAQWSYEYVNWKTASVYVTISRNLFVGNPKVIGNQSNIGLVIYKTLGKLLPSQYDMDDREKGRAFTVDVYSDVITLTIPELDYIDNANTVKIVYKNIIADSSQISFVCAFWNYSLSNTISGGWSRNGCRTVIGNTSDVTCYCTHLTSFALVGIRYTGVIPRRYELDIMTYIGLGLSLVLLLFAFLVYICLGQLNSNANSIHKNLILVAFLAELVFLLGVNQPGVGENGCRIIAIIIHYFFTCAFSWLLVEALHMYRMILEARDINYGQMMFYYFIGWGAPVMVVGVTAGLKPEGYGNEEFCWISIKGTEIMWTYFAPILVIMAGHILLVFFAIGASCERQTDKKKRQKMFAIRYRSAISLIFLALLGATVVSGLISVTHGTKLLGYVFPGLCVLEGVYLVMFYVCFNRKVRHEGTNAYIRWKTGDKTYGIKKGNVRGNIGRRLLSEEHRGLVSKEYRATLQAFNIPTSSTTDSSDNEGRRRAKMRMAGSETTDFPTTNPESSDSSDDDNRIGGAPRPGRRPTIDSDSSDNSSGPEQEQQQPQQSNGKLGESVEWRQAQQKKLINKRTYASDGPMHSTPSESDTSDRQRWQKVGFTPTKVLNSTELSAIQSESDHSTPLNGAATATRLNILKLKDESNTDSDTSQQRKEKPVSILKKKSQYDVKHRVRVCVKDGSRKPLMLLDDTVELNDSQV